MFKKAEQKAVARTDITYWEYTKREMKRNWIAYVMILPYIVIFALFTLCPVILSFIVGFTDFNMLQWPNFVWIENYVNLFFADDIFIIACKNTLIFATIVGPTSYIMSFLVAWFINELPPRIRAVITLIFYAPSISGGIYTIWGTLFDADTYGWVNATLIELGILQDPIAWFKDADYIMPLCIVVSLWMSLGTGFLSIIAGLQGVDRSLYEAGAVLAGVQKSIEQRLDQPLPVIVAVPDMFDFIAAWADGEREKSSPLAAELGRVLCASFTGGVYKLNLN